MFVCVRLRADEPHVATNGVIAPVLIPNAFNSCWMCFGLVGVDGGGILDASCFIVNLPNAVVLLVTLRPDNVVG